MAFPASALSVVTFRSALDATQLALNLDLDTHKVALYTNSATGSDMVTDTIYGASPWITGEVSGTGYTAGGQVLTGTTFTSTGGGVVMWDATDPSWATSTFTARGALYYADALGDQIIMCQTFGADITATAGTFLITLAAGGLFSIDFIP